MGVVRMKLARDATASGAGFGIPINLVKDFLDAHGLLGADAGGAAAAGGRPLARLEGAAGGDARRLPGRLARRGCGRRRGRRGTGSRFRIDRVATPWDRRDARGGAARGTGAAGVRARRPARPCASSTGAGRRVGVGTATGTRPDGQPFRVEYAVIDLRGESGRGALPGPARRPGLQPGPAAPVAGDAGGGAAADGRGRAGRSPRRFEAAALPGGEGGRVAMPHGLEPRAGRRPRPAGGCPRPRPASRRAPRATSRSSCGPCAGLARARAWRRPCGPAGDVAGRRGDPAAAVAGYAGRFDRLGVPIEARGVLVQREGESLLLEIEAPGREAALRRGALRPLGPRGRRRPADRPTATRIDHGI